jgi:hypothetical protein
VEDATKGLTGWRQEEIFKEEVVIREEWQWQRSFLIPSFHPSASLFKVEINTNFYPARERGYFPYIIDPLSP